MRVHGSCHCGAIQFSGEVDPTQVVVCHCDDCQILSGAPYRAVISAPMDTFEISGAPRTYVKVAQSGNRRAQVFCPDCGTALYGAAAEHPTHAVLRLGCLAERDQLRPSRQIWTHSAADWTAALGDVPASPAQ
ncbi:GFA family protein [Roseateles chitinivorans]|uniref:GFA family protein n=1 Tax=Roseateles chitinivorans TaxID=2917965 RepID=UPI003D66CD4E